ncbi:Rap1a/Tai family immunity protein [Serratia plymuthica]|uniref:Rap1a/Tai family immunity protein n=1 Tax=Serratia plymuthica TaxID=82996 RepID=UPI00398AFA9C
MLRKLLLICCTVISSPSIAQYYDGNTLNGWSNALQKWKLGTNVSNSDLTDARVFQAYVGGVVDAVDGAKFCIPDNVKLGQLFDITSNYLSANPEKRALPASEIVITAISDKFPCNGRPWQKY